MLDQLHRAILALAQPPEVQLALFPDFVCKADELALDFEDGLYELAGHKDDVTAEQQAALDALDGLITGMSGERNAAFWTEEALLSNPGWDGIRSAARATAAAFGWEIRPPGPSGAIYISASGRIRGARKT